MVSIFILIKGTKNSCGFGYVSHVGTCLITEYQVGESKSKIIYQAKTNAMIRNDIIHLFCFSPIGSILIHSLEKEKWKVVSITLHAK